MRIIIVRRICQAFFLVLLLWFAVVTSVGTEWWQLRGWPVNWLLQLDPLVALGTVLTTHTLYAGLLWAVGTLVLTILLGRFFCGWFCPFGTMHQFVGWLGKRGRGVKDRIEINQLRRAESIKYYILAFLLAMAVGNAIANLIRSSFRGPSPAEIVAMGLLAVLVLLAAGRACRTRLRAGGLVVVLVAAWVVAGLFLSADRTPLTSLQTGLLDPIPLVYRSVNLALLPIVDAAAERLSPMPRLYEWGFFVGAIFLAAIFLNLLIPRFYCRYICPLGALFGLCGRFAIWRIGKKTAECSQCLLCEADCEGACRPSGQIRIGECVLCMNCVDSCRHDLVAYRPHRSAAGEVTPVDVSRRGMLLSIASSLAVMPLMRLGGKVSSNWHAKVIRPPGALGEKAFLARCLKCGQCMRICPTNVIQPAGLQAGAEGLWTPILNNRIGTSGCQFNCVACGQICPTGAIRTLSLDEKTGQGEFVKIGPVRMGTAYVDRGRCLPWAMDRPCIVCQENCSVSPKAIFVRKTYQTVRGGELTVASAGPATIYLADAKLSADVYATGDYYLFLAGGRRRITANTAETITLEPTRTWQPPAAGTRVEIQVRLQRPHVDLTRCIGCGICEHECPVSGKRAIRVTAENESRSRDRSLLR